jgi:DNA-binding NtrC family response regulator
MKFGAYDYLTKPCRFDELKNVLGKAYEKVKLTRRNVILEKELARKNAPQKLIGESSVFRETVNMAIKVASSDCTVLLQGESGVGKEVIARLIHANSLRKEKQFVVLDCASLQEALLESELFGHEKGAFTGAYSLKHGLLEVADSGTFFMDEIGEIGPSIQSKLLRVLETGTFRRVGGIKDVNVDVRIIAATNKDLMRMVEEKTFRDDLFYRLNVISISIPPLRNRSEDIPQLAEHFLKNALGENTDEKKISPKAMELLMNHEWPGNIRELQNVIHRAVILSEDNQIKPSDLPSNLQDKVIFTDDSGDELLAPLEEMEKKYISFLLKKFNGHRGKVARTLKMSERNLYRRLGKLGLRDLRFK